MTLLLPALALIAISGSYGYNLLCKYPEDIPWLGAWDQFDFNPSQCQGQWDDPSIQNTMYFNVAPIFADLAMYPLNLTIIAEPRSQNGWTSFEANYINDSSSHYIQRLGIENNVSSPLSSFGVTYKWLCAECVYYQQIIYHDGVVVYDTIHNNSLTKNVDLISLGMRYTQSSPNGSDGKI